MRRWPVLFVFLCVLLVPGNIFSCGNMVITAFVYKDRPDREAEFIAGNLGILRPGFQRRYLTIAYRYLQQKPLTASEKKSLEDAMRPNVSPSDEPYDPDPVLTAWVKARSQALGLPQTQPVKIVRYKRKAFLEYPNCGDDAFENARKTAVSRAQTFGAGSPALREWVAGQDAVFQNCGSEADLLYYGPEDRRPPETLHLPPPGSQDNALLRADGQYQLAAANFYGGKLEDASALFEKIASDPGSPWHQQARYLVARCYIRKATLGVTDGNEFLPEPMAAAEERLLGILKDPSLSSMHPAARSLLDYVEARLHPEERIQTVAAYLAKDAGNDFEPKLFDYTYLLGHYLDRVLSRPKTPTAIEATRGKPAASAIRATSPVEAWRTNAAGANTYDDLTDWVLSFGYSDEAADQYRFQRWQALHTMPWLLSLLVNLPAGGAHAGEIEQAAAAIGAESPAYDTVLYHRVRLLLESNRLEAAGKLLDNNMSRIQKASPSNRNAFLAQRFSVAAGFSEFLRFAARSPLDLDDTIQTKFVNCWDGNCTTDNSVSIPAPARLELDSANVFNRWLSVSLLARAAMGDELPPELRQELAGRSWLRAAILDDVDTARELEPAVKAAYPELRTPLEQYDQADSVESRRFALIFMVMQFPGMQPYVNAGSMGSVVKTGMSSYESWWCYDVGGNLERRPFQNPTYPNNESPPPPDVPAPRWLSASEREQAAKEWKKLYSIGDAPTYFSAPVLDWAKKHPDDPRVPEALHYFVRATRFGCADNSIGPSSQRAFQLLHQRYPASEWARKTPYWFGQN